MKYVKRYLLFLEDENTDDVYPLSPDSQLQSKTDSLHKDVASEVQNNLKEFQSKKQKMEEIFKDVKITNDVDLEKALISSIYGGKKENRQRNKFLKGFESILRSDRRKNLLQSSIGQDTDRIKQTTDDINRLNDESRITTDSKRLDSIKNSLDLNNKRIKELKDNIQKNKSILSRDSISWQKERDEFKKDMVDEENRLKKLATKI